MRILVTGGFGFIGSHLVERLLNDGHQVHVVDNLSSSPMPYEQLLTEFEHPDNLTYSIRDVHDYFTHHIYLDKEPNLIYHLASPVGTFGVIQHAGDIAARVTQDGQLIAKYAQWAGNYVVNVSTSECYGGGQQGLCREDMPCVIQIGSSARLEYAVAKLATEVAFRNTRNLECVHIRPFNVAGARQSGVNGFVLPRFVRQAMNNEAITVFGDGSQVRAFTNVKDIVDGLVRAAEKGKSGEIYNLGNDANRTTILDLAKRVQYIVGGGTIILTDGKQVFGEHWCDANDKYPDASKAITELGWQPTIGIDETIRQVWEYEKAHELVS